MYHALIFNTQNSYITRNLGAHRIATFLREQEWDVEVVDYAGLWPQKYLLEFVKSRVNNDTVFIGFSDIWGVWHFKDDVAWAFQSVIDWVVENYPRVKIVVGSQKVASSAIKADYYIEGYGEYAMLALVKHLLGTGTEKLKYTLYRSGKLIKGSDYPAIYMKDLFVKYEARDFIRAGDQLGVEWSRGCKFSCDFCNFHPLNVKGDNFRDVQNYIDNLKYLNDEYGVTSFFSADSTGNVSPDKLELFGNETQRQLNFNPWICAFTRIDLMISQPSTWDSMIAMGYTGHHYGIETLNYQSGKSIKKGMHPDKIKQGLLDIQEYFSKHSLYRTRISLVAGLPYETYDTFLEGVNWIYDTLPDANIMSFPLWIPHPDHWDPENRSLISSDYKKYGYRDINEGTGKVLGAGEIDWVNDETGTSYQGFREMVSTHPDLAERELLPSPWLIGELQLTTGLSFEEALDIRWADNREVVVGTGSQIEHQWYSKEGTYNYVRDYIMRKINWHK